MKVSRLNGIRLVFVGLGIAALSYFPDWDNAPLYDMAWHAPDLLYPVADFINAFFENGWGAASGVLIALAGGYFWATGSRP
jgi:hypothetical protein